MKKALAFALMLGVAACGDKAKVAPVSDTAPPTSVAAPIVPAAEPVKADADKELARRVERAIQDAKLHGIDIVAASGAVTLWGTARTAGERTRAAQTAAGVEGVKSVDNKLAVVAGS